VTREASPVVAEADPDLRRRDPERLVVVACGQGDIDYLGVENGSPADATPSSSAMTYPQSSSAVSTTSRSFARSRSSLNSLPKA
jgi:hypothetical protein